MLEGDEVAAGGALAPAAPVGCTGPMDDALRRRRLEVIEEHLASEVDQEWERTLATFGGRPHHEIVPTGQVFDGRDEELGYYETTRTAFPDQHHGDVRLHVGQIGRSELLALLGG